MPNKQPGALPLPRPDKYLRQLFDALRGRNQDQVKQGDGVILDGFQVALIRETPGNLHYDLVIGDGDVLYQVGTLPVHAVQHLTMQTFGSAPEKRESSSRFDGSATQDDLRRMGYNPIGLGGDGRHVR